MYWEMYVALKQNKEHCLVRSVYALIFVFSKQSSIHGSYTAVYRDSINGETDRFSQCEKRSYLKPPH